MNAKQLNIFHTHLWELNKQSREEGSEFSYISW